MSNQNQPEDANRHSVANPVGDDPARLSAPAALRNAEHILNELQRLAPSQGRALELASGTGEHAIRLATALPGLIWQPTDVSPERLASIAAWRASVSCANLLVPRYLDAGTPGWGEAEGPVDLILVVNLLHLIPQASVETALRECAGALAPGGIACIYGPFLRNGVATSDGDAAFDARLRAEDANMGLRDVADIASLLLWAGLSHVDTVEMPANNLLLCYGKSSAA